MRILIPLLALLLGVAVAFGVLSNNKPASNGTADHPAAEATDTATSATPAAPTPSPDADDAREDAEEAAEPAPETETPTTPEPAPVPTGLAVLPAASPQGHTLGGLDPEGPFKLEITVTSYGAGLRKLQLADYAQRIENGDRYTLVDPPFRDWRDGQGERPAFYPLAALTLTIGTQSVGLNTVAWSADEPVRTADSQSVTYRANLVDGDGQTLGEVVRTWTVYADSYDIALAQHFINRTDRPLDVRLDQYGVGDLLMDEGAYVGDRRMFVTGYFKDDYDPNRVGIYTDEAFWMRSSLIKKDEPDLWPSGYVEDDDPELAWLAVENRYFTMVAHLPVPEPAGDAELLTRDVPSLESRFPIQGVKVKRLNDAAGTADIVTTFGTAPLRVEPGASADLSLNIFAGPRKKEVLAEQPYAAMQLEQLIRYELGCTWCTFQFLAHWLLGYLKFLNGLVFDWGVAIILLVVTVRLLLHPITKRAQTNMMKMGKQMAAIQPEMQKLKEKYKDDPTKMNQEVMKLYKEKGVNPAGFLGCLPMLLQTPIWIALYAMLYYAIELRHEHAFYGVFQTLSGGSWKFLADLSVADHFIKFPGEGFKLNLIFVHPTFAAINILPLLMAVVFYVNMKFTTPPPATEEQRKQQRIMKIMPLIFPIFLYSAPSGLTLYICASTLAGIFDSYIVRKHIKQQEEAGTLFEKKEAKPGSLKWKLQQRVKLAQEMAAQRMEEQQKRKQVQNTAGPKQYKNRKKK